MQTYWSHGAPCSTRDLIPWKWKNIMCMNEKREPNGHFSYPLGNVISIVFNMRNNSSESMYCASLDCTDVILLENSCLKWVTSCCSDADRLLLMFAISLLSCCSDADRLLLIFAISPLSCCSDADRLLLMFAISLLSCCGDADRLLLMFAISLLSCFRTRSPLRYLDRYVKWDLNTVVYIAIV